MSDLPTNIIDSLNKALTITSQANVKLSKSVAELTKQRDELLAALEMALPWIDGETRSHESVRCVVQATIASVKEKA